jgi:hypothetical protein
MEETLRPHKQVDKILKIQLDQKMQRTNQLDFHSKC